MPFAAFTIAICIALYVGGASVATTFTNVSADALAWGLVSLIATILLLPSGSGPYLTWNRTQYQSLQNDYPSKTDVILHDANIGNTDKPDKTYNLKTACLSPDFWLLFIIFFLGVGSGITLVNSKAMASYHRRRQGLGMSRRHGCRGVCLD